MSDEIRDLNDGVKVVKISEELGKSFLDYSMSVIVARALPDVRDGLKPVQRRILYSMSELGMTSEKPHKKSARIVGDVIGKYHPHGDSSVYEAMVRMAQDFSYRYPLVDGHGNFGSIDGDGAAAMRYTEARLSKLANEMVRDLDKNTVDVIDNYDASEKEPEVLPAGYPNLLVNGSTGIAVGMATNIPPHNLGEVIDGLIALMENSEITTDQLMQYIKGPDFPTGAEILGLEALRQAYDTGNGTIKIRAKTEIERDRNRSNIVVTEIPYMVNKSDLIEKIASLTKLGIVQISDIRDESSLKGMRIVLELKRDADPEQTVNLLYKHTKLQDSFSFNMIGLVAGVPLTITLKDALSYYLEHRLVVVQRKTKFLLGKALARKHIVEGLVIAVHDIDNVIQIIKSARNVEAAKTKLIEIYQLSDIQAREILSMQLRALTGLEITKLEDENRDLDNRISEFNKILGSTVEQYNIIKSELLVIKENFADERKTTVNLSEDISDNMDALIKPENIVIAISHNGYICRVNESEFESQKRGGRGVKFMSLYDGDYIEHLLHAHTHNYLLFFTKGGKVFSCKGYIIRESNKTGRGMHINNILFAEYTLERDSISSVAVVKYSVDKEKGKEIIQDGYAFFTTKLGIVKKVNLNNFVSIRKTGKIAIKLHEGDEILSVQITDGNKEIILCASNGKASRFLESEVSEVGTSAKGVFGMKLIEGEFIVSALSVTSDSDELFIITDNGYGKRTISEEITRTHRTARGVYVQKSDEKKGNICAVVQADDDSDILVTTDKGITIRTHARDISLLSKNAKGFKIINIKDGQKVSSLAVVPFIEDSEIDLEKVLEN
ncbi:MAG: DNA gyrase subunit A [Acholeplasmatales bacterium]|jgi:DNA gyrase subunit A|nr:DNA gyrase subunit A [Acholeplasmatales bacterium]